MTMAPSRASSKKQHYLEDSPIPNINSLTDDDLFHTSQRSLSKRLPLSTSSRATFTLYLRWLDVHRQRPSRRTEHWSNTLMHWIHSLAARNFTQEEIYAEVSAWKRKNSPSTTSVRHFPTKEEIRLAWPQDLKGKEKEKFESVEMGDSWKPKESRREGEESMKTRRESSRLEELRELSNYAEKKPARERKNPVDMFDKPPPANYICNRCGKKGHHLQVCPTNLDPVFDRAPDKTYRCEICDAYGKHFKSLCPKNTDPFSINQKRKNKTISSTSKLRSRCGEEWKPDVAHRPRDRLERKERARLATASSTSSPRDRSPLRGYTMSVREKLLDIEDKKMRLFREQSDDIGDMLRESIAQIGGKTDRKRGRVDEEDDLMRGGLGSTAQRKKIHKTSGEGRRARDETGSADLSTYTDMDVDGGSDNDNNKSVQSLVSYQSDRQEVVNNGPNDHATPVYSLFVQQLMRRHPEISVIVNHMAQRTKAVDMWPDEIPPPVFAAMNEDEIDLPSSPFSGEGYSSAVSYLSRSQTPVMMQYDGGRDDEDEYLEMPPTKRVKTWNSNNGLGRESRSSLLASGFRPPSEKREESAFKQTGAIPARGADASPGHDSTSSVMDFAPHNTTPTRQSAQTPSPSNIQQHSPQAQHVSAAFGVFRREHNSRHKPELKQNRASTEELKSFGMSFKLNTKVPQDLLPLMSQDLAKQKEMRDRGLANARNAREADAFKTAFSAASTPTKAAVKKSMQDSEDVEMEG